MRTWTNTPTLLCIYIYIFIGTLYSGGVITNIVSGQREQPCRMEAFCWAGVRLL